MACDPHALDRAARLAEARWKGGFSTAPARNDVQGAARGALARTTAIGLRGALISTRGTWRIDGRHLDSAKLVRIRPSVRGASGYVVAP
jgi:hypothetical protein